MRSSTDAAGRTPALVAVTRFGLGPNAADLTRATPDPEGFVLRQFEAAREVPPAMAALEDQGAVAERWLDLARRGRELRRDLAARDPAAPAAEELNEALRALSHAAVAHSRARFEDELGARVATAIATRTPFIERLVLFWSNHFAIAIGGRLSLVLVGHHERAAIRPNVLGRFEDLLQAAVLHPAMLHYLDNRRSFGPDSPAGRRSGTGINENLAREVLELHTLGVDGGYTQADVRALALALTGWSGTTVEDAFARNRHQPGAKTVMGRTYARDGRKQALDILSDLARHPATARHLAGKLARHFTGDAPPEGLARRLERTWRDTDGDLAAVTRALVTDPAAWTYPPRRMVPPYEFVASAFRTFGGEIDHQEMRRTMRILGQPVWEPVAPTGWPDHDRAWLGGDSLLERLDWSNRFAEGVGGAVADPVAFARAQLGVDLGPDLEVAIGRAEDRRQAIALMLMSPQWQRR